MARIIAELKDSLKEFRIVEISEKIITIEEAFQDSMGIKSWKEVNRIYPRSMEGDFIRIFYLLCQSL